MKLTRRDFLKVLGAGVTVIAVPSYGLTAPDNIKSYDLQIIILYPDFASKEDPLGSYGYAGWKVEFSRNEQYGDIIRLPDRKEDVTIDLMYSIAKEFKDKLIQLPLDVTTLPSTFRIESELIAELNRKEMNADQGFYKIRNVIKR